MEVFLTLSFMCHILLQSNCFAINVVKKKQTNKQQINVLRETDITEADSVVGAGFCTGLVQSNKVTAI